MYTIPVCSAWQPALLMYTVPPHHVVLYIHVDTLIYPHTMYAYQPAPCYRYIVEVRQKKKLSNTTRSAYKAYMSPRENKTLWLWYCKSSHDESNSNNKHPNAQAKFQRPFPSNNKQLSTWRPLSRRNPSAQERPASSLRPRLPRCRCRWNRGSRRVSRRLSWRCWEQVRNHEKHRYTHCLRR